MYSGAHAHASVHIIFEIVRTRAPSERKPCINGRPKRLIPPMHLKSSILPMAAMLLSSCSMRIGTHSRSCCSGTQRLEQEGPSVETRKSGCLEATRAGLGQGVLEKWWIAYWTVKRWTNAM